MTGFADRARVCPRLAFPTISFENALDHRVIPAIKTLNWDMQLLPFLLDSGNEQADVQWQEG